MGRNIIERAYESYILEVRFILKVVPNLVQ